MVAGAFLPSLPVLVAAAVAELEETCWGTIIPTPPLFARPGDAPGSGDQILRTRNLKTTREPGTNCELENRVLDDLTLPRSIRSDCPWCAGR